MHCGRVILRYNMEMKEFPSAPTWGVTYQQESGIQNGSTYIIILICLINNNIKSVLDIPFLL